MRNIKFEDFSDFIDLDVKELLEIKGGLGDNNTVCLALGNGLKCDKPGSGFCSVAGSGIVCTVEGSGLIAPTPSIGDGN